MTSLPQPDRTAREVTSYASDLKFYLNGQPAGGGKYARRLAQFLRPDQGLYVAPVPIFEQPITVEELASKFADAIVAEQPVGPYFLGGNCFGATVAFEIAQQLHASGRDVSLVALIHPDARTPMHVGYRAIRRAALLGGIDEAFHFAEFSGVRDYIRRVVKEIWLEGKRTSPSARRNRFMTAGRWIAGFVARHARRPISAWSFLHSRAPREADEQIQDQMREAETRAAALDAAGDLTAQRQVAAHARYMSDAWTAYTPRPYAGKVAMIWPVAGPANPPWNPRAPWAPLAPRADWRFVPGNHWTMLHDHFDDSARALADAIASVRNGR